MYAIIVDLIRKIIKNMPRSRRTINTEDNMQYNNTKDTVTINPPHKYESSEYKDIVINIPEGCEIDVENSELAKGIIKFKKTDITYEDVVKKLRNTKLPLSPGYISVDNKVRAYSRLSDIAKYYNGDWKPDWSTCSMNKCYIYYDPVTNDKEHCYKVGYAGIEVAAFVYFKNAEDAQAVIDNPNFKDILDTIYKN